MNRKLSFTITEGSIYWRTHRIMELCEYLTANVLEPMFARDGAKWNGRFMDFFTFDNASDPLEPTGTIRFVVPPLFAGRVRELQTAITQELAKLRIKTGPFQYERDPALQTVRAIRISITDNPTALAAPPDVNMSRMRGCVVLRDLLGYQWVNGRYEFTADDLLKRVSSVTEDRIAACTASPVKGAEGVRRTPSPVSMKAVRRCLDEVKQFGLWALNHNHRKLAAV
jgi:sirohydrochlorin ferrochelatase